MSKFITILIMSVLNVLAFAQQPVTESPEAAQSAAVGSEVGSFWAMAQLGGNIGYGIMVVLALGVFLIVLKGIQLIVDRMQSRPILQTSFSQMDVEDIDNMVSHNQGSILGKTLGHLIDFHRAGGHAESIHNELVFYVDQENEGFETYRNWLHFLSASAGALGLLGTVWGVFLTFFGGNLDSEKILNGMGVALITTLLGLGVSLIINLFSTQIYGAFQKRLELVTRKADELRLHLLHIEGGLFKQQPAQPQTVNAAPYSGQETQPVANAQKRHWQG